jgi:hypothetical protein
VKTKIIRKYINEQGNLVTVYASRKVLSSEKTWPMIKGSVFNMGAQATKLACSGMNVRKHG